MRKYIAILPLALIGLVGCTDWASMSQTERAANLALPPTAENIKFLVPSDGSWHTFDLAIEGGQKVRILRHFTSGSGGTESMVVLPQR